MRFACLCVGSMADTIASLVEELLMWLRCIDGTPRTTMNRRKNMDELIIFNQAALYFADEKLSAWMNSWFNVVSTKCWNVSVGIWEDGNSVTKLTKKIPSPCGIDKLLLCMKDAVKEWWLSEPQLSSGQPNIIVRQESGNLFVVCEIHFSLSHRPALGTYLSKWLYPEERFPGTTSSRGLTYLWRFPISEMFHSYRHSYPNTNHNLTSFFLIRRSTTTVLHTIYHWNYPLKYGSVCTTSMLAQKCSGFGSYLKSPPTPHRMRTRNGKRLPAKTGSCCSNTKSLPISYLKGNNSEP